MKEQAPVKHINKSKTVWTAYVQMGISVLGSVSVHVADIGLPAEATILIMSGCNAAVAILTILSRLDAKGPVTIRAPRPVSQAEFDSMAERLAVLENEKNGSGGAEETGKGYRW